MLRLLVMLVVGLLALGGCREQSGGAMPAADPMGTPSAAFSQDLTGGEPGLTVRFVDDSTGPVESRHWDFGNGVTSSDPTPTVTFMNTGRYTVSLTVTGPRGASTLTMPGLIDVAPVPRAAFDCTLGIAFAPATVTCFDVSGTLGEFAWDFGDGGTSTSGMPEHVYDTPGDYTVTLTRTSAGGSSTASLPIRILPFEIGAASGTSGPPGEVVLEADTGTLNGTLMEWTVDGARVGLGKRVTHLLQTPGVYTIAFTFMDLGSGLMRSESFEYTVRWDGATADFAPSVAGGDGPLDVVLTDRSTGDLFRWDWDFGDGTTCTWPAPSGVPASDPSVCDGRSPSHTYTAVGRYDVALTVTGRGLDPGDPDVVASTMRTNAVTVYMLDPSFEEQTPGEPIAGGWTALPRDDEVVRAAQVALASSQPGGPDAGMPTDGTRWARLDAIGSDGSVPVEASDRGIEQAFLMRPDATVLELDYVLVFAEPPASPVLDAVTATVSDGTTTVEIPSARADVSAGYAGISARTPTIDGSVARVTPVRTASLDLASAFPGAGPDTLLTLTVRVANDANAFRPPRAYVDHVRFVEPGAPLAAAFALETDPVVSGRPARFTDETCLDAACEQPTSWRWDFDMRTLTTPPPATASGEQDPEIVFPEPGLYDVTLTVRRADQDSSVTMTVSVLEGPEAAFDANFVGATTAAPATVSFTQLSTADPADPIVAWSWDFGGWGTSTAEQPGPVLFGQSGTWPVRLTITTDSGLTDTVALDLVVD